MWVDNSHVGGVFMPASVTIHGSDHPIVDTGPEAPRSITFSNLNLDGDTLDFKVNRNQHLWVFLSEVQFQGTPEPASLAALGIGAASLLRRRRKA